MCAVIGSSYRSASSRTSTRRCSRSVPSLRASRTKHVTGAGVWARITVTEGTLRYRVDALGIEIDLAPDRPGIVVPELAHSVQPIGAVRFSVEFLRASDGGP